MTFRIATWNVWNLNRSWRRRFATIRRLLQDADADVVCLQEVSIDDHTERPQSALLAAGSGWRTRYWRSGEWHGREEGLAILSRFAVEQEHRWSLPEARLDMPRQVCAALMDVGGRRLLVANTHLAYRLDAEADRVRQAEAAMAGLEAYVDRLRPDAVVLAGDFNCVPTSPALAVVHRSPLRLCDVFEGSEERHRTFTFAQGNPLVDPALGADRWIDYIFVSSSLTVRHRSLLGDAPPAEAEFLSDHFGLLAECRLDS